MDNEVLVQIGELRNEVGNHGKLLVKISDSMDALIKVQPILELHTKELQELHNCISVSQQWRNDHLNLHIVEAKDRENVAGKMRTAVAVGTGISSIIGFVLGYCINSYEQIAKWFNK